MTVGRERAGGEDGTDPEGADSLASIGGRDGRLGAIPESRTVIICDHDGETLTEATIRLDGGLRLIVLADVEQAHVLMDYFFGRGGSQVFVVCDGKSAEGRLETRWHGIGRTWMVRMLSPIVSSDLIAEPRAEQASADAVVAIGTARSG